MWWLCASLLLLLLRFFSFNVFSNWIKMADIDLSSDFYFVFLFFNEELDSMLLCLPSLSPSHLLSFSMDFNKWRVIVSEQKIHVLAAILILFDSPVYYTRRIHANNPRCFGEPFWVTLKRLTLFLLPQPSSSKTIEILNIKV